MHRRTASLGDDRRRCEPATPKSGIQSEGCASRQSEVVARRTRFRRRDGACPVSLRGERRGKPRLYGKSHVELPVPRMATSTVAGAKRAGTPATPRPVPPLLRYVLPYWWPLLPSAVP